MGSWFVNYFSRRNASISVFDSNKSLLRTSSQSVITAGSISECVSGADLVMVCVPVRLTPRVIRECSSDMKSGATLAEISSVKYKTFAALSKTRDDLGTLCLHPMFGPGASEKRQVKMLLVPVRNEQDELRRSQDFFAPAKILVIQSARKHDSTIAIVLGSTCLCILVFSIRILASSLLGSFVEARRTKSEAPARYCLTCLRT